MATRRPAFDIDGSSVAPGSRITINLALPVVQMEREGKLVFQSDTPPADGVIQFSRDGVHPLDAGHQIYSEAVADAVQGRHQTVLFFRLTALGGDRLAAMGVAIDKLTAEQKKYLASWQLGT